MSWTLLYEDEYLVAIDKPAGLLVVPDRWDRTCANLVDQVRSHLSPEWRNVHRLDRDTSGVVLFARSVATLSPLAALFETGAVEKTYLALVRPPPRAESGRIDRPLDTDPRHPGRMRVALRGKPSCTEFRCLQVWPRWSIGLLEVHPRTGRTHQIRVHLAASGSPVLVDPWYGDGEPLTLPVMRRSGARHSGTQRSGPQRSGPQRSGPSRPPLLTRLALHAHCLEFVHPFTGQPCRIESPCPGDLQRAIEQLDG